MTDPNDEPKKSSVNADYNSIAVGGISAGGDISGNIHIGNVYQTPEDDLPLSSDEIENGLTRFAQYLPERAPVLQDSFLSIAKKLRATLGADQNSLSPALKAQREDGVNHMKLMCMEVTDISFRAICLGQNPPPYDSRPPFLGLFAFRPEDREFFFGRDALVQKLVTRIKAHPFLAVLGASGSGKSSLVMAGLVPALEAEMSYLTPSSVPLYQLLEAKESASADTVFVIDQFEELFTHPHDAAERADFIHELLELTKTNRVVITMRADFWGEVAIYTDLKQAMQEHQELIAPMNVDELHSAMEKQAAVVGLRFDPALSASILAEVKGEPGAMPLLQHALWELWNRRHGLWIKAEEYQAFGGVKQAIASTAEEVYASCSDFERTRVRDIFLRLTRLDLDESAEGRDTRRRVLIEELIPVNSDSSVTIKLLNKLADARLIVKTDKDVEVAHEALIRHWSRLTEWLNEDRDNLRLREGLSESAREWENSKRDDSLLNHRGGRLELAMAMSKLPRYQLNPIEQAYLNASVNVREKEKANAARRRRITVASVFAVTAVIMVILIGWSISSTKSANANATQVSINFTQVSIANTSQANAEMQKLDAEIQSQIALARQLAAQARSIYTPSKQEIAVLLSLHSMELFPIIDAAQIIQTSTITHSITPMTHDRYVTSVTFSPDGKYVVSGSRDKSARVWEVATGAEVARMTHDDEVTSVALSPDGDYVVSGSDDGTARVWEATTGIEVARMTHDNYVTSVAFSPDGKYVVSGSGDGTARVWEATTGIEVARVTHKLEVTSVAFSPDGKYVVSAGCDEINNYGNCQNSTAHVWETATNKEIARIGDGIRSAAFSPNGKYIVSAGGYDGRGCVWEATTGMEVFCQYEGGPVLSVAFSPDGKYVVSGSVVPIAHVWDFVNGYEVAQMNHDQIESGGAVTSVAFSPDGKYVVSGSRDKSARVWEVATGAEVARMTHDDAVTSVAFSPDGKYVVSGSYDGVVRIWETTNRVQVARPTFDDYVTSVAFSPDGKYVVSGGDDPRIWEMDTGAQVARLTLDDYVNSVAFSPDGKYVVSGSRDGTARVWEATTGKEVARMTHDDFVYNVAFSPDGKYVVSGSSDGTARVWEVFTGQEVARMTYDDHVTSVAFSPDGKYVVSAGCDESNDNGTCMSTARVWEATTGKEVARMTHDDFVYNVAFSPDGKYVVSGSSDGTARVWEVFTGQEVARMTYDDHVTSVAFSPDGKYVVSAGCDQTDRDGICMISTARLWETTTGNEVARMTHDDWVTSVAFSPDGKYVASAGCDANVDGFCFLGTARVWEATTGVEVARMTYDGTVDFITFHPNGKYVVSAYSNDTYGSRYSMWIYLPEDLIANGCSRVTRNLTPAEWKQYIGDALPYPTKQEDAVCPNLPIESESK